MDKLDYERLSRNPEAIQALVERARRERAETVYRLLIAPIARLFARRRAGAERRLELGACSRTAS